MNFGWGTQFGPRQAKFFLFLSLFILRERERERESEHKQGGHRERRRERESQASSPLSVQSPMEGTNPQIVRSWPEPKSRVGGLTD